MNQIEREQPTQQKNEILTTLLSSLPGMAFRCQYDRNWSMEFASEGCLELTGYPPEDLIGNRKISFGQMIHPQDRDLAWKQLEIALREKKPFDLAYRINTPLAGEKWVRVLGRGEFTPKGEVTALEGFISDMTDRKEAEKRIHRQVQRFEALRKIDIAITASLDQRVTLDILLDQVTTHLDVDAADVLIYNPGSRLLEFAAGRGFRTMALQHTRLRLGDGYAGISALERRSIQVLNLIESLGELGRAADIQDEGFYCYFCVPLIAKGQVKGILEVFHRTPLKPDVEWLDFLEALAGQAAIAIDNATLFNELQRSNLELSLAYDATLEGWSRALELRDQETEGHTKRVTELTLRLAQAMHITSVDPLHIRRGALLHDIGKMGIPDSILRKPGPLSSEEWEIMRKHPGYAYQWLSPIASLRPALDIPYCHHEKWDGSGYPRGLKGEQIPLTARVFAVVDVWESLNSARVFRPEPWPREKALAYMVEQSGKHFDPDVVNVFLNLLDETSFPKPRESYQH